MELNSETKNVNAAFVFRTPCCYRAAEYVQAVPREVGVQNESVAQTSPLTEDTKGLEY